MHISASCTCAVPGESLRAHMTEVNSSARVHSTLDGFSESQTHRQRWMFPNTWKTQADSELTNSLSSSAARSGQPWQVRHTERLKQEETGALQVHAHIPHLWCGGRQTHSKPVGVRFLMLQERLSDWKCVMFVTFVQGAVRFRGLLTLPERGYASTHTGLSVSRTTQTLVDGFLTNLAGR